MSSLSFKKPVEDTAADPVVADLGIKSLADMNAELNADPIMGHPVLEPISVATTNAVGDALPIKRTFMVSLSHNPKEELVTIEAPNNSKWEELAVAAYFKIRGIFSSEEKPKVVEVNG